MELIIISAVLKIQDWRSHSAKWELKETEQI